MKGWILFLSHFLLYECTSSSAGVLRGRARGISGNVRVYHISPEGKREEAVIDDEAHVIDVLCSKALVSKLHPCADLDSAVSPGAYSGPQLYPMVAAYREAVQSGFACPLPGPFMEIVDGKCCVGRNTNVWPNVCHTREHIGIDSTPTTWDLKAEISVREPPPLFPPEMYKIGRPDVPNMYADWRPNYMQILSYLVMYMIVGVMLGYVYNRLEEETAVVRGKKRQELILRSKKNKQERGVLSDNSSDETVTEETDVEDRSVIEDDSSIMYPAVSPLPVTEQVDQVSTAFGLLPSLPRGRSVLTGAPPLPHPVAANESRG